MSATESRPFKKGYKFRIYPTEEQKVFLSKTFGCCRYVYNRFVEENYTGYKKHLLDPNRYPKPTTSGIDLTNMLPGWKVEEGREWLREVSSDVLQQVARNMGQAFKNMFNSGAGKPRYKKKTGQQSARLTKNVFKLDDGVFSIAKLDNPLKVAWSRKLPSYPSSCTITMTPTGKYFVSFICDFYPDKTAGKGIIGIDAGITDLATLSNGTTIDNIRSFVTLQGKLAKAQSRHSRKRINVDERGKKSNSKNREKARLKVARIHEKIANIRKDYTHKVTTRLVSENQAIAIETLLVSKMVRNPKLAKHIMDAGWGMFRSFLEYKTAFSNHCKIFKADPFFPSTQLCSECGYKPSVKLKLGTRKWTCSHCGTTHQRDHNAAINLENLVHKYMESRNFDDLPYLVKLERYKKDPLAMPMRLKKQSTVGHTETQRLSGMNCHVGVQGRKPRS